MFRIVVTDMKLLILILVKDGKIEANTPVLGREAFQCFLKNLFLHELAFRKNTVHWCCNLKTDIFIFLVFGAHLK